MRTLPGLPVLRLFRGFCGMNAVSVLAMRTSHAPIPLEVTQ